MQPKNEQREKLRAKLKEKLGEKCIMRSSKHTKKAIFDKTLSDMGIDKEKFKQDMEDVKKQGGLTIDNK